MTVKWNLSKEGKDAYFIVNGKPAPRDLVGSVDPTQWTEEKRAAIAPYVHSGSLDLTKYDLKIATRKQPYGSYKVQLNKDNVRAEAIEAEAVVDEFIQLLEAEEENKVWQENWCVSNRQSFTWEPVTIAGAKFMEEWEEEYDRKEQARIAKSKEESAAQKARQEENKQKEADLLARFTAWAKAHGSELVKRRMGNDYYWEKLAAIELVEALVGATNTPGLTLSATMSPSIEAMSYEKKVEEYVSGWDFNVAVSRLDETEYINVYKNDFCGTDIDLYFEV